MVKKTLLLAPAIAICIFSLSFMTGVLVFHSSDSPDKALHTYAEYGQRIFDNEMLTDEEMEDVAQANALEVLKFLSTNKNDISRIPRPPIMPSTTTTQSFIPVKVYDCKKIAHFPKGTPHVSVGEEDMIHGTDYDLEGVNRMLSDDPREIVIFRGKVDFYTQDNDYTTTTDDFMSVVVKDHDQWRVAQFYTVITKTKAKELS